MKTRDRILATSLLLFNQEGEQSVTTVDIANEMDISPGNLYYHFKGKESIIDALYNEYENGLIVLLQQSIEKPLSVEEYWLFLYVLFEENDKFRFFYLNAGNILLKYPDIERRFRRLIRLKVETIETLSLGLMQQLEIAIDEEDLQFLAENVVQTMLYWFPYQQLLNPKVQGEALLHKGVYHVLSLFSPYTGVNQKNYLELLKNLYKNQ